MIPYHDLSKINHPLADDILSEINVVIESNKFVMNTEKNLKKKKLWPFAITLLLHNFNKNALPRYFH